MKTREEKLKTKRAFYWANREKILTQKRKYADEHKEELREKTAQWRKRFPERARESSRKSNLKYPRDFFKDATLKHKYGISLDEFNERLLIQKGKCAICGKEQKLCVDHCHQKEKVRGLLCRSCNIALGLFEDESSRLLIAAKYLQENG